MKSMTKLSGRELKRLHQLAEFRYQMRRFLHFSEQAAGEQGMTVQQYQLLQVLAAVPEGLTPNIAYVAQRMFLRHNTAVELVARAEADGLVGRATDAKDHRKATLSLTAKGSAGMVRAGDGGGVDDGDRGAKHLEAGSTVKSAAHERVVRSEGYCSSFRACAVQCWLQNLRMRRSKVACPHLKES